MQWTDRFLSCCGSPGWREAVKVIAGHFGEVGGAAATVSPISVLDVTLTASPADTGRVGLSGGKLWIVVSTAAQHMSSEVRRQTSN